MLSMRVEGLLHVLVQPVHHGVDFVVHGIRLLLLEGSLGNLLVFLIMQRLSLDILVPLKLRHVHVEAQLHISVDLGISGLIQLIALQGQPISAAFVIAELRVMQDSISQVPECALLAASRLLQTS